MLGLIPFRFNNGEDRSDLSLNDWYQDFFNDDMLSPLNYKTTLKGAFKTDIKDTPEKYIIHAELPGFNKEDINISYKNNYLTISAVRKEEHSEHDDKTNKFIRKEIETGEVTRNFYFDNISDESIHAKYDNGILTVELPKKEPTAEKEEKKITIE